MANLHKLSQTYMPDNTCKATLQSCVLGRMSSRGAEVAESVKPMPAPYQGRRLVDTNFQLKVDGTQTHCEFGQIIANIHARPHVQGNAAKLCFGSAVIKRCRGL